MSGVLESDMSCVFLLENCFVDELIRNFIMGLNLFLCCCMRLRV